MGLGSVRIRNRGYLPHWEAEEGIYSVTFRLGDSLPQEVLRGIVREREGIEERALEMGRELTVQERARLDELYAERIEEYLDRGVGACHLRDARVGQMVFDAVRFFHGERYKLHAWCVMPNHVHALFCPEKPHTLDAIMHSWKSYTANEANRILGRRGVFWMPEYYDHLIRNKADFRRAEKYILENPKKAGLGAWPWVGASGEERAGGQDARVT